MTKLYFTKREALVMIKETLENGYDSYLCDLHYEVFNSDYYIIGTKLAEKALSEYGTFNAIGQVVSYEKDNFGEILTDISEAEKVSNMLMYIIGQEVLSDLIDSNDELNDNWNEEINLETSKLLIELINKELSE